MQKRNLARHLGSALIVIGCVCSGRIEAQQKMVFVQREEDVIANSVVQQTAGTNKVIVAGIRLEQWIYGDQFIYFEDGKYIDYQEFNSR
jgi:hypothetical protein